MVDNTEGQEVPVTPVSSKSIIALASTFVVTLGAIAVAYYTNGPDSSDRFYGREGRALRQHATENRETIQKLHELVTTIQHNIETIEAKDMRCEMRQDKNEERVDILRDKVHSFQSAKNREDEHQTKMIDFCMRGIGL